VRAHRDRPHRPQLQDASLITRPNTEARDRFAQYVYGFIAGVRKSQAEWLVGVTSFEDYVERRLKTVGTEPIISTMQWAYNLSLPASIWNHKETLAMMHEVAVTVFLFNDLVSLKKEVAEGDVESAVPILVWNEGISAQAAVNRLVKMLETSWEQFKLAEQRLEDVVETQQIKRDLAILVGACKDVLIGHMIYTLRASRYMTGATFGREDSSFKIVL